MEQTPSPSGLEPSNPVQPSSATGPFQNPGPQEPARTPPPMPSSAAFGQPVAAQGDVAPNSEERTLALVAHGLTFIEGGFIGPLVIYLLKKKESDFVAFHALQSLAFTGLYLLVTFLSCGLLGLALVIPYVVFEIIACIRAYEGEWYELPIVGAWARRKHPGNTMSAPPRAMPPAPPPPPAPTSGPSYEPIVPLAPAPNPTGAPMPRFY